MKFRVEIVKDYVCASKDYNDCNNREEITLIMAELAIIQRDLLEMYENFDSLEIEEEEDDKWLSIK